LIGHGQTNAEVIGSRRFPDSLCVPHIGRLVPRKYEGFCDTVSANQNEVTVHGQAYAEPILVIAILDIREHRDFLV
jgi:hypothetical protein